MVFKLAAGFLIAACSLTELVLFTYPRAIDSTGQRQITLLWISLALYGAILILDASLALRSGFSPPAFAAAGFFSRFLQTVLWIQSRPLPVKAFHIANAVFFLAALASLFRALLG
jgi:hypothetical protein